MPAAAVIPAPVAYIKVVAVKKLVVRTRVRGRSRGPGAAAPSSIVDFGRPFAFPALSAGVNRCIDGRGSAGFRRDSWVRLSVVFFLRLSSRGLGSFGGMRSVQTGRIRRFLFSSSSALGFAGGGTVLGIRALGPPIATPLASPSVISPPRVLLTECPRRPVRSL